MMTGDIWRQNLTAGQIPPILNRFEEIDELPLPQSMSANDLTHKDYYTKDSGRCGWYVGHQISFEKAAAALYHALDYAAMYYGRFENDFRAETDSLRYWATPKATDLLWRTKIEWNGIPVSNLAQNPNVKPGENLDCYNKHVKNVMKAWEDMNSCGPAPLHVLKEPGSKLSAVEVKTNMRKLQVSFRGIVELMRMVRTERNRMRSLVNQLDDARVLLFDIDAVWKAPMSAAPGTDLGDEGEPYWPQ